MTDQIPTVLLKRCMACTRRIGAPRNLPMTAEYFYRDRHQDDGFATQCKDCRKLSVTVSRHRRTIPSRIPRRVLELGDTPPEVPVEIPVAYKRCSNPYCGRILPESEEYFYKISGSSGKSKLNGQCRRCSDITRKLNRKTASPGDEGYGDKQTDLFDMMVDGQEIPAELLNQLEASTGGRGEGDGEE